MSDMAATNYIVERIESDLLSANRNMAWRAVGPLGGGLPMMLPRMPDASRPLVLHEANADEIRRNAQGDMIRILDREGNVVWFREHRFREHGVKQHAEIMENLMKMDAAGFRKKYGIIPDRPLELEGRAIEDRSELAPGSAPAGSALDPAGPWGDPNGTWTDRVARSEGGAKWAPSNDAGGSREGDLSWGDPAS